jgi:Predicted sugar nucleotidyltransferases
MKAVILAAGMASRLRPLTDNTPKCLLKIGDKCLLGRTLDALIQNNISRIVLVTGYLHQLIEQYMQQHYPHLTVEFIHNELYSSTNNIYSLWLTKESVKKSDIWLLDSDIVFDPQIIKQLRQSIYPTCLALNKHELSDEEIKVITNSEGKIKEISKTCSIKDAVGESIGIEKMSREYVDLLFDELDNMILTRNQTNVFYEAAFENTIHRGADFYAVDTTGLFSMELDTVEDFESAREKIPAALL